MRKYLSVICVFLHLFADSTSSEPRTPYRLIHTTNLASLEWLDEDWPNESFREYLNRCLDYQVTMQPAKKRRLVFTLFDKLASKQNNYEHSALFDLTTAQDLALFCGQKMGDPYIADIVCRTKTEFGRVYLYGLLAAPVHDRKVLENRQAIIKNFVDQEELYTRITADFVNLARTENILLSFWAQDGFSQATKRHYFSIPYFDSLNKYFNNSELALSAKSIINHQTRAFFLASGIFAALILPYTGCMKLAGSELAKKLKSIAKGLQGSAGMMLGYLSSSKIDLIAASASISAGIFCAMHCKDDYEWMNDNFFLDNCLQQKMQGIAQFFQALTELKKTLDMFSLDFPADKKNP